MDFNDRQIWNTYANRTEESLNAELKQLNDNLNAVGLSMPESFDTLCLETGKKILSIYRYLQLLKAARSAASRASTPTLEDV